MATTPIYGLRYQTLSDPPDGADLGEGLASGVEAELSRIDSVAATVNTKLALLNRNWASYSMTWTCVSGGNPTAGSHTIISQYKYVDEFLAIAQCKITFGGSGYGGGIWLFTLPFPTASALIATGTGHLLNTAIAEYDLQSGMFSTTQVRLFNANTSVTPTFPFTVGAGDILTWQIMFQPA